MQNVFLGFGSNLGDRSGNINKAIVLLGKIDGVVIDKVSSIIETEPVEAPGPNYLNAVVKIKTVLEPECLLSRLQKIETTMGRRRSFKNAPRTIDIDLLLYGDRIIRDRHVVVPHPLMCRREFVMAPLKEIEPEAAGLARRLLNVEINPQ